jgi:hypothetical protein
MGLLDGENNIVGTDEFIGIQQIGEFSMGDQVVFFGFRKHDMFRENIPDGKNQFTSGKHGGECVLFVTGSV